MNTESTKTKLKSIVLPSKWVCRPGVIQFETGCRWRLVRRALGLLRRSCTLASCWRWTCWSKCCSIRATPGHMCDRRYASLTGEKSASLSCRSSLGLFKILLFMFISMLCCIVRSILCQILLDCIVFLLWPYRDHVKKQRLQWQHLAAEREHINTCVLTHSVGATLHTPFLTVD